MDNVFSFLTIHLGKHPLCTSGPINMDQLEMAPCIYTNIFPIESLEGLAVCCIWEPASKITLKWPSLTCSPASFYPQQQYCPGTHGVLGEGPLQPPAIQSLQKTNSSVFRVNCFWTSFLRYQILIQWEIQWQSREKYKCRVCEKYLIEVISFDGMELDLSCCAEDLNPFLPG